MHTTLLQPAAEAALEALTALHFCRHCGAITTQQFSRYDDHLDNAFCPRCDFPLVDWPPGLPVACTFCNRTHLVFHVEHGRPYCPDCCSEIPIPLEYLPDQSTSVDAQSPRSFCNLGSTAADHRTRCLCCTCGTYLITPEPPEHCPGCGHRWLACQDCSHQQGHPAAAAPLRIAPSDPRGPGGGPPEPIPSGSTPPPPTTDHAGEYACCSHPQPEAVEGLGWICQSCGQHLTGD